MAQTLKATLTQANSKDGIYAAPEELFNKISAEVKSLCTDDDSRSLASSLLFDKFNGIFPFLTSCRNGAHPGSPTPPPPCSHVLPPHSTPSTHHPSTNHTPSISLRLSGPFYLEKELKGAREATYKWLAAFLEAYPPERGERVVGTVLESLRNALRMEESNRAREQILIGIQAVLNWRTASVDMAAVKKVGNNFLQWEMLTIPTPCPTVANC